MEELHERRSSALTDVSNAMVALHKEQFGRGPTKARAQFAGDDVLVCVLRDVLLPAEHKLVEMGEQGRVREARMSFQVATASDFVAAVEKILRRKVESFASAVDPDRNVAFEVFCFEPRDSSSNGQQSPA